ncbi:MAG TPA: hypothetical protein DCZ20_09635 [Lachnospiraceae bacterium]|nr:hypothetical protein [Lachnospiraceae bacterium]
MLRFEELHKDIIVFSYQTGPIMGTEGEDGGFSLCLYGNGNLKYCTYRFFEQINLLEMFKMTREETKQIYDIIAESQELLEKIPARLDNGSTDGYSNEFEFLGHERICAWNIRKSFVQGMWLKNRKYYGSYKENMQQENMVLGIFEKICKCLKEQGILLSLTECRMRDDCRMRITWKE